MTGFARGDQAVAACQGRADADSVQAYLQALANAEFGMAFRQVKGGVELKTVTAPG